MNQWRDSVSRPFSTNPCLTILPPVTKMVIVKLSKNLVPLEINEEVV